MQTSAESLRFYLPQHFKQLKKKKKNQAEKGKISAGCIYFKPSSQM